MEKKEIVVEVFNEIDYRNPIRFSEIKDIVQDDDIIESGWDEGFYTENNSVDGHYYLIIRRKRLETDEEVEKRHRRQEEYRKESKQKRHELYLKLKEEFENKID